MFSGFMRDAWIVATIVALVGVTPCSNCGEGNDGTANASPASNPHVAITPSGTRQPEGAICASVQTSAC